MMTSSIRNWLGGALIAVTCAAAGLPVAIADPSAQQPLRFEDATRLSAFGERSAYSPDGKWLAFIGKSYGDAFEIELAGR